MTGVDLLRDDLVRVRNTTSPAEADPPRDLARVQLGQGDHEASPVSVPSTDGPRCALCGERAATAECLHCGRPVCAPDRWVMFGLCRACLTPEEVRRARDPRRRPRPELGIKWVDE